MYSLVSICFSGTVWFLSRITLSFLEQVICRCNLPCRGRSHFHCPFCEKTIIRKAAITTHLIDCQTKCDMVQLTWDPPPHPPSPETHPVVLSLYMEHSYLLLPSVAAVKIDHSYIQTAPLNTPAVATDIKKEEPVKLEKTEDPAMTVKSEKRCEM